MTKADAPATPPQADSSVGLETASIPDAAPETPAVAEWASEDALFGLVDEARCDACGEALPADDGEGYGVAGEGVYMWTRGEEVRMESAPLCPSCASAIGMTALARWEIEEEEG